MLVNHNETITPQNVTSLLDVQGKIRTWVDRAQEFYEYKEASNSESQIVLTRKSKAYYEQVIIGLIITFLYGFFMYGVGGIILVLIFGICYACYIPFLKDTAITVNIQGDSPFAISVHAKGNKKDFQKVVEDLKYIMSTQPDSVLE